MAEEVLPIKQGDTIYFYDTTIGDVASYSWVFTGGTPSTSTNMNEYVTFNGTNEGGYSVSHSVTSVSGITVGITKSNIISVSPETISSAFTRSPSTSLMSENVTYTSGATASSGIANYSWTIPGLGSTSGTNLNSISYVENNWYAISGTYSGSVNSSYLATSSLTITSNVPNISSTNQNITYYKMGPAEIYDLDNVGLTGPYYTPSVLIKNSGDLGIGGSSIVVKIDQSSSWSGAKFNNQYFHSSDEVLYFYPNTLDVSGGSPMPIRTRIIFNKSQLDIAGASYLETPAEFTSGSYVLPAFINDVFNYNFYITDYTTSAANTLTNLINLRGWETSSVEELLKNTYYKSTSSKYIETLKIPEIISRELYKSVTYGYDWSGGYSVSPSFQPGLLVPSSAFFDTYFGAEGLVSVSLSLDVYNESGILLDSLRIDISTGGDVGNSPDGFIITSNNTVYGSGLAKMIQDVLDTSTFSGNFIIDSSSDFSPFASDTSKDFPGMRVSILDPYSPTFDDYIGYVMIYWYGPYIDKILGLGADQLTVDFSGSSGSASYYFSGLPEKIGNFTSPTSTKRGWSLGGEIA